MVLSTCCEDVTPAGSKDPKSNAVRIAGNALILGMIVLWDIWQCSHVIGPLLPIYDGEEYIVMAYNMAMYGTSSTSTIDDVSVKPDFAREPFPSFLYSLPMRLPDGNGKPPRLSCLLTPGDNPDLVNPTCAPLITRCLHVNVVIHVFTVLAVFAACLVLTGSTVAALVSAILMSTSPVQLSYLPMFTAEPLSALALVSLSLSLAITVAARKYRIPAAASAGLWQGIFILCKTTFLYCFLLAVLAYPAIALIWHRARSKKFFLPFLVLTVVTLSVILPWLLRNYLLFGKFSVVDPGRGCTVLQCRAYYSTMSWKEYFAGYVYYTPYIGPKLAVSLLATEHWRRFDDSFPDSFNSALPDVKFSPAINRLRLVLPGPTPRSDSDGRLLRLTELLERVGTIGTGIQEYEEFLTTWKELAADGKVPSCMRLSIGILLENWYTQVALVPLFAWRGMFIGGCSREGNRIPYLVVSMPQRLSALTRPIYRILNRLVHGFHVFLLFVLVPIGGIVIFWALRRGEWLVVVFALPMVLLFAFLSAFTNFYPRFGMPLVPGLIVLLCTGASWWHTGHANILRTGGRPDHRNVSDSTGIR
ncbi:MAG: hypothetical protein FJY85_00520 [Deltaproteobacteria bacterium]|nr:hypothetical protein [Deltaproteobacteria bacterium]